MEKNCIGPFIFCMEREADDIWRRLHDGGCWAIRKSLFALLYVSWNSLNIARSLTYACLEVAFKCRDPGRKERKDQPRCEPLVCRITSQNTRGCRYISLRSLCSKCTKASLVNGLRHDGREQSMRTKIRYLVLMPVTTKLAKPVLRPFTHSHLRSTQKPLQVQRGDLDLRF